MPRAGKYSQAHARSESGQRRPTRPAPDGLVFGASGKISAMGQHGAGPRQLRDRQPGTALASAQNLRPLSEAPVAAAGPALILKQGQAAWLDEEAGRHATVG